jgi:hypothetical protein
MLVKTYLNDGPGRFFEYQPGDRLHVGPEVMVPDAVAHDEDGALAIAWAVGNRMQEAWVRWAGTGARDWPSFVRSLSAGDVLVIGETAWAVAHVGFDRIDTDALERSLSSDAAVDAPREPFGPPARSAAEAGPGIRQWP